MTASEDSSGRLTRLEEQIDQIVGRLATLERALQPSPPVMDPGTTAPRLGVPERLGSTDTEFTYSGQGKFGLDQIAIRQQARMSDVENADPGQTARVFTALASPARIMVLRALLHGPRTSRQLRGELDDASVGQLYHHLRELIAAGLIVQPARSQYAITQGSQVALCIQFIAAAHLGSGAPYLAPSEQDQAHAETSEDGHSPTAAG